MDACKDKQEQVEKRTQELVAKLVDQSKVLGQEIQERAKQIMPDFNTDGPAVWIGVDFDIRWKTTEFSLDLPEITMKDQTWSLDLPQITMKDQEILFETPSVRMKTVKTGEYPEFYCSGLFDCRVRWSPIYIDVPEPFMQSQRIVLSIPEVRMGRTEFVLGIPEFTLTTQRFSLDLPEITIKDINAQADLARRDGEALSAEAQQRADNLKQSFKANAQMELGVDVAAMFDCFQQQLMTQKNTAMKGFEDGIALIQSTITAMVSNKVPDENPMLQKAKASLADLLAQRDAFAQTIESKFVELSEQQKSFFDKFLDTAV